MLRPSKFNKESGLWVWTPDYDEDNDENESVTGFTETKGATAGDPATTEPLAPKSGETSGDQVSAEESNTAADESGYVMELGDQIRFKVKSINFTQVTKTAKGMQATTTTTAQSVHPNMMGGPGAKNPDGAGSIRKASVDSTEAHPVRKRSLSVDLTESQNVPASMHVVASICEDGLGLTSWWETQDGDDDEEEE